MADIFLSYARENSEIAKRLSKHLESLGWSVWCDREISADQTWRDAIEQSLASMRCMVVLWSKESIDSNWVKEKAEEGHSHRKLVPVLIGDVKPPMGFRAIQAAKLIGWDGSPDFPGVSDLVNALETQLGKPVQSSVHQPAPIIRNDPSLHRQPSSPIRIAFSKILHIANRLPRQSYATATVLVWMSIAASLGERNHGQRPISPASLPVESLGASELQAGKPLTIRGPTVSPSRDTKSPALTLTPAINDSGNSAVEKKAAKRIDANRSKLSPIPSTAPIAYQCSEIHARARLGEPLSDRDRDALRKECQS